MESSYCLEFVLPAGTLGPSPNLTQKHHASISECQQRKNHINHLHHLGGTDRISHKRRKEEQEPADPEILSPEVRGELLEEPLMIVSVTTRRQSTGSSEERPVRAGWHLSVCTPWVPDTQHCTKLALGLGNLAASCLQFDRALQSQVLLKVERHGQNRDDHMNGCRIASTTTTSKLWNSSQPSAMWMHWVQLAGPLTSSCPLSSGLK